MKNYTAPVLWITGLSGSGKTTLAKEVYRILKSRNLPVILFDGDELREIFKSKSIQNYSREERMDLAMKYSKLCLQVSKQGLIVAGSCKPSQKAITPISGMKKRDTRPQQIRRMAIEVMITVDKYTSGIIPIEPLTRLSERFLSLLALFLTNLPRILLQNLCQAVNSIKSPHQRSPSTRAKISLGLT